MHYLDCNESVQHGTPDLPIAHYYVDEKHPRYRMPMHWHIECELLRVISGRFELYLDDARLSAGEGDLIVIGKGAVHGGEPSDCVYECVVFDPGSLLLRVEACAQALSPLISRSVWVKNDASLANQAILEPAGRLFDCLRRAQSGYAIQAVGCLFELFAMLTGAQDGPCVTLSPPVDRRKTEQLEPALKYIESHYGQHISLDTLARLAGLSPKYFCRYFRAIVHRSPIDYLNFYRVERASFLLSSSDMTVAEVAYHCGFNDSSFFIKQFRHYKGMTPRRYREEHGGR